MKLRLEIKFIETKMVIFFYFSFFILFLHYLLKRALILDAENLPMQECNMNISNQKGKTCYIQSDLQIVSMKISYCHLNICIII